MHVFTLLFLVACNNSAPPSAPAPTAPAPGAGSSGSTPAFVAPDAPSAGAAAAEATVDGTVEETMDAAGYTYLRLKTAEGERWAAVPETKVTVGQAVSLTKPMMMKNFQSKTLNRTFDEILFARLAGDGAAPMAAAGASGATAPAPAAPGGSINPNLIAPGGMPGAAAPAAAPSGAAGPHADAAPVKVEVKAGIAKADQTVAELYAKRKELSGKSTSIRGQVVKVNTGILGKNWLHLRDGSGTDAGKDNDVTVTTGDIAAVGDVVLVTGKVTTDKDFGAGYSYTVVIEDAAVKK